MGGGGGAGRIWEGTHAKKKKKGFRGGPSQNIREKGVVT